MIYKLIFNLCTYYINRKILVSYEFFITGDSLLNSKILIVENERIVADDIKNLLEELGYDVIGISGTGKDALSKTYETNPDLILMDIILTGNMDGIETAQQINELYHVPFIYLTAYYDDDILERASQTQPAGYITKPFTSVGLHTAIQMALYKQKKLKEI
jgi:two-component system, response regulator PdtaR